MEFSVQMHIDMRYLFTFLEYSLHHSLMVYTRGTILCILSQNTTTKWNTDWNIPPSYTIQSFMSTYTDTYTVVDLSSVKLLCVYIPYYQAQFCNIAVLYFENVRL